MKIAFVGMTHLGLNSAVAAAGKGFSVVCFDENPACITQLQNHACPISEPLLNEWLLTHHKRLHFTHHFDDLSTCDLIYVAPDIPTDASGTSNLTPLKQLLQRLFAILHHQIVVVLSQVPPGFMRTLNYAPLFYQVETLIFGQAIERASHPERLIIGTQGPLPQLLQDYLTAYTCPVFPMSYESAELAKIAINMFLVSSVTTTNTLVQLCEKIGAPWNAIATVLRLDKRIGPHAYLSPGLGIAGGNLERDLKTFCTLAEQHGTDASVVAAWQKHSQRQCHWVLRQIHKHVLPIHPQPIFAILGLAYKKDTDSIKNSPALALIESLQGYRVRAFDPTVTHLPDYYPTFDVVGTIEEACAGADVLLIMTPWDMFRNLMFFGKIVIDPYKVLLSPPTKHYHTLGASCEASCPL